VEQKKKKKNKEEEGRRRRRRRRSRSNGVVRNTRLFTRRDRKFTGLTILR
jgi:hypothetical protein